MLARSQCFVSLDNVNMIKKGYVHRNTIEINGNEYRFTLPIDKISQNKLISETYTKGWPEYYSALRDKLHYSYRFRKHYNQLDELLSEFDFSQDASVADLAVSSISSVINFLELDVKLEKSSSFDIADLKGQDRIIELCKLIRAENYLNLPSGKSLYDVKMFEKHGITLEFIEINNQKYKTWLSKSGSPMSMLDTIARFPKSQICDMISQ